MTKQIMLNLNAEETVEINLEELKFKSSKQKKFTTVKSKSELFRQLYDLGFEVAEIAKETESHYSFVYGVISSSRELREVKKETKSDIIREMAERGMKPGEIAKQLNSNYSFVHTVVSKHLKSLNEETKVEAK